MPLAYIQELGGGERPDNSLPGGRPPHASNPIVLPILPGIYPPPGTPNWPPSVVDPGWGVGGPDHIGGGPIIIQGKPDNELPLPPGIYPPLPPVSTGKVAILILVVGVGYRWLVVDPGVGIDNTLPGTPQPKK